MTKKVSKEQGSKSKKGEVSGKSGKMWDGGPVAYEAECQVRTKKLPEWKHEHKSFVFRYISAKYTMMGIHGIITRKTVAMETFFFFLNCVNSKCEKTQNTVIDGGNEGLKSKYSEIENVAY